METKRRPNDWILQMITPYRSMIAVHQVVLGGRALPGYNRIGINRIQQKYSIKIQRKSFDTQCLPSSIQWHLEEFPSVYTQLAGGACCLVLPRTPAGLLKTRENCRWRQAFLWVIKNAFVSIVIRYILYIWMRYTPTHAHIACTSLRLRLLTGEEVLSPNFN